MKTIKELFEVYKPKSPDEQKFVDKHVTIKHKDRNGNDDDVFNATKIKPIKRKEERHGYDSGEDEKVYEDLEISDEELVFELDEEVEALEEGTVYYKHYTITSHPKVSGASEGGDIKHVFGHPKKMGNLDIEHDDTTDYGTTRRVTVKNSTTGETTHHHVYQSERSNSKGKPTLSIRTVGKASEQQDKHANVIAHYLSGKTKLKEDTDLAFFDELLEMNLDEDTFTDASLAQLRVMKHKQKMKEIESSSKTHPLMKVRKLSDAKKKLAELEAARDKLVAAHEKAQAKKKVTEEVEELEELSKDAVKSYMNAAKKDRDYNQGAYQGIRPSFYKDGTIHKREAEKRQKGIDLASKKLAKEEVDELDEAAMKFDALGRLSKGGETYKTAFERHGDNLHKIMSDVRKERDHNMKHFGYKTGMFHDQAFKAYRVWKANRNTQNESVELDEKTLTPAEMKKRKEVVKAVKRENPDMDKSMAYAIATKTAKRVAEDVEYLDEGLMHDRYLRSHGKKARGTGAWAFTTKQYGSPKENEMHFTSGQKSLSDAHKEAAAKLGTKHLYVMEEVEELDELSFKKLVDYTAKSADSVSGAPVRKQDNRIKGQSLADKKIRKMDGYSSDAKVAATNEEVEELDELSKGTMGNYIKKAKGDVRYAGKQYVRSRIDDDQREMSYADRLAMKRYKGINMAVDKLTKEDIINRAIEKYMPEDYVAPSLDEQFIAKIDHLAEGHAVTLLALFDSLNEENKKTMLETVDTQEGVNSLLDFAIKNRGE